MKNYHFEKIMTEIQNLEEMGGPEGIDYIRTLESIKAELEVRINTAKAILEEEKLNDQDAKMNSYLDSIES